MSFRFVLLLALAATAARCQQVDEGFYEHPGVTAAEILRARGFIADELYYTTSAGYRLRITRGRNPLFKGGYKANKEPVLFVHGILAQGQDFLINSFGASPKDFSSIDLTNTSLEELKQLLADEPSAKSLALLALNFAHEVWLWNRRGAAGSRELVGDPASLPASRESSTASDDQSAVGTFVPANATAARSVLSSLSGPLTSFISANTNLAALVQETPLTLDTKFWNYSFDEQVQVDFPEIIEFVLKQTGRKRLALVAHSAGGAISLMSQSMWPDRLGPKISANIHWSPAYSIGNENPALALVGNITRPLLEAYVGPAPPTFVPPLIQADLGLLCSNPLARATVCRLFLDTIYGRGGGHEPAYPQLISSLLFTSSSHELAQLQQMLRLRPRSMHKYDYGPVRNLELYNQTSPPAYDLGQIKAPNSTLSIYAGATDMLVTLADINATRSQLTIPYEYHQLEMPYSHIGYFFNDQAPMEAIIPSMREIEVLAQRVS